MTDIADNLGVSRAALYHYVDGREDLVFKVYRRSSEILARHLGEAARSGRHPLEVVHSFVASILHPDSAEIASPSEIGLLGPAERETVLAIHEGVVARLASVLETGAREGAVRKCDFAVAARCIISLVHWAPLAARWTPTPAVPRERVIAVINDLCRLGTALDRQAPSDPPWIDMSPLLAPNLAVFDRLGLNAARREAILLEASLMFNAKGVDTTSLDEIATQLNSNKRTLYRYVGDKQAIIAACYERAFRICFFMYDQADEMSLNPADRIVATGRGMYIAQQRKNISPLRTFVGIEALSPEGQAVTRSLSIALLERAQRRFGMAQNEGGMRKMNLNELMLVSTGPATWLPIELNEARQVQVASEIAEFVRLGLTPL